MIDSNIVLMGLLALVVLGLIMSLVTRLAWMIVLLPLRLVWAVVRLPLRVLR